MRINYLYTHCPLTTELPQPPYPLQPTAPTAVAGQVGDDNHVLLTPQRLPLQTDRRVPWPVVDQPGGITELQQQRISYTTVQPSLWLRNDISADLRFLTAACLSAVLLRSGWQSCQRSSLGQ